MRKAVITKEMIMEATISFVSKNGLENVTAKKVAAEIGISEGSIFNYFENKRVLLTECLYYIDREIDIVLKATKFSGIKFMDSVRQMWYAYFKFMLAHGDYAKFYRDFRHSSYYDDTTIKGQDKSFSFFSAFSSKLLMFFGINTDVFWIYVIETTLNFAVRMSMNQIEPSDKNIDMVFNLIVYGMSGIVKKYKETDFEKFEIELPEE